MKKFLLFLALCAYGLSAELNVAAAANTAYAFEDIKAEFAKAYPNDKLNVTLSSSGKLVSQIKEGAPFDVFMSADVNVAKKLFDDTLAVTEPKIYARGKVAMLSVRGFDLSKGLEGLKDPKIKSIIVANPDTAPYGKATIEALKKASVYDAIKSKIITAGTIGEALSQTLKAGDIGFVAASSMYSPKMANYKEGKDFVLVDSSLYMPIDQAMVLLKKAENNALAKSFYDFILGDKGREIWKKYGYDF